MKNRESQLYLLFLTYKIGEPTKKIGEWKLTQKETPTKDTSADYLEDEDLRKLEPHTPAPKNNNDTNTDKNEENNNSETADYEVMNENNDNKSVDKDQLKKPIHYATLINKAFDCNSSQNIYASLGEVP